MAIYYKETSKTLNEYLLLPQIQTIDKNSKVSFKTRITKMPNEKNVELQLPIVSAAMDTVSSPDLATMLALEGGMSFIPAFEDMDRQVEFIEKVKKWRLGFKQINQYISPEVEYGNIELTILNTDNVFAITDNGTMNGKILGVLSRKIMNKEANKIRTLQDVMIPVDDFLIINSNIKSEQIISIINESKKDALIQVGDHYYIFDVDIYSNEYENASIDSKGQLIVGAAVNTWDYKKRVSKLIDAGVDILCIDSLDGYSNYIWETIQYIRENYGNKIILGAGNIVDSDGFCRLAETGIDFVKVGMSGGIITPERETYGQGLGQATAIKNVAKKRDEYFTQHGIYIPICADGYIRNNYQIALSIAMGADFVMMGRYFASLDESPSMIIEVNHKLYKKHSGQCSESVSSNYGKERIVEKGIDSLISYKGKAAKELEETKKVLKRIFMMSNAVNITSFKNNAIIVPLSAASCGNKTMLDIIEYS